MNKTAQTTKTPINHTEDKEEKCDDVIQVPEDLIECLKELVARVCNLVRHYDIMLPVDYREAFDFHFAGGLYVQGLLGLEHEPDLLSKFKIASPYLARSRAQTIRWNASSVTNSGDARLARVILRLPVEMALAA